MNWIMWTGLWIGILGAFMLLGVPAIIMFIGAIKDAYYEWRNYSKEGKYASCSLLTFALGFAIFIIGAALAGIVL